jgi:diaminopimelate decarboxylase
MSGQPPPALARTLIAENFGLGPEGLEIGGLSVAGLVESFGSPLYLYDAALIRQRYRSLREAVAGFAEVYYSIKANPNPAIAALLVKEGAGLEIASGAEFLLARQAGCPPARILFAGPGKGHEEIELAIRHGVGELHLEGFDEIALAGAIAKGMHRKVSVSLRINPGAAAQGGAMRMGGKPSAFGFDEEIMAEAVDAIREHEALDLTGIHLFAGTQILDAAVLLDQWRYGLDLAARLAGLIGRPLHSIDLGGGLGIPYHAGDTPLDLDRVRAGLPALIARVAADPLLAKARVLIEPGRYLAGPTGLYVMRLRAVKASRGQRFLIADGGMHHHLAASGNLGMVIKRDYPIVAVAEPEAPARSDTHLVGPLCTPLDTLGRQTTLPDLVPGDLVAVLQSGAYGLSSSPVGFLSHPMPAEVLVEDGEARVIRPRGDFANPLVNPGAGVTPAPMPVRAAKAR